MGGTVLTWILLIIFMATWITTVVMITSKVGSSDNLADMRTGITTVTVMNGIMTAILALIGYLYVYSAGEEARGTYLWFLVHIALLIAVVSASVSSLQRLDAGAVNNGPGSSNCPGSS